MTCLILDHKNTALHSANKCWCINSSWFWSLNQWWL